MRAVSHLSVVQDLWDVARDRSFKHVFLGGVVTRNRNAGVLYFESLWYIRGQGGIIIYHPVLPVREVAQCPIKSDTGHEAMN